MRFYSKVRITTDIMRRLFPPLTALFLAALCAGRPSLGQEAEVLRTGSVLPLLSVTDGRAFHDVVVKEVHPDGIKIRHRDGIAHVPAEQLADGISVTPPFLTGQARLDYRRMREETAAAEVLARAQAEETKRQQERERVEALNNAPRLATADDVKSKWLRSLRRPHSLDRNFERSMTAYRDQIREIRGGARDKEAQEMALEWNVRELERAGDPASLESARQELAAFQRQRAEEQMAMTQDSIISLLRQISDQLATHYRH